MDYPIHLPDQLRSHLKSLRKTKNLTQAQLGKLLGVGQVRIAEIEQNPAAISVEQLIKLLAALEAQVVLRPSSQSAARPPAKNADRKGSW
jgi:HTH-type transcriptional regulator/antitoxin HipB